MIPIPKLDKSILPYPPPKNYRKKLGDWLKNNPWVTVGDGVMFPLVTKVLGTKTYIKDGTIINGPMVIKGSGNVTIGKYCGIAENLYIISSNHKIDYADAGGMFSKNIDTSKGPIYIGNNVWIGDNVTVLTGVKIGDGAAIGSGSVVTRDIPPFAVAVGAPARVIKYRFSEKVINKLLDISWWHWNYETIQKNKLFFNTRLDEKNINDLEGKLDLQGEEEIIALDFNKQNVKDYLLDGWWEKEANLCWTSNKEAVLVLKTQEIEKFKYLSFFGSSFHQPQKMSVIINQRKTGSILMNIESTENKIRIVSLKKGINTIKLIFKHGFSPSQLEKVSTDKRKLFCQFSKISLTSGF